MLTAWIALDDVTEEMGPLRFVDKSHRWGVVPTDGFFHEADGLLDRSQHPDWHEVTATMPAGSVSFHAAGTVHGSGPNTSGRPGCWATRISPVRTVAAPARAPDG